MESVYFLGTVCTSRTDERKMDMDNFHIHHKIRVDYSTEVCSWVVLLWGTSPPRPWQLKSETRHVSIDWICTYFISKNMTLCPAFSWLASNCSSSNQIMCRHKGPVESQLRFSQNNRLEGDAIILWRDSPVCSAAEVSGVVAGQGSQSVCWWRGVWGAVRRGGPGACKRPASVLIPQMNPGLSAERVLKEPSPPPSPPLLSSLVPCSAAPGWARWERTTGWAGPGSWSRAKTGHRCTGCVCWWGRVQSWPRGSACTEGGCCPVPEKLLQTPHEGQRGPEPQLQLPSTILHTQIPKY